MKVDEVINELVEVYENANIYTPTAIREKVDRGIKFIKQQQAEIKGLRSDRAELDIYIESQGKKLEQLKASQPVLCSECDYFSGGNSNKGYCEHPIFDNNCCGCITVKDRYCSYGKRIESVSIGTIGCVGYGKATSEVFKQSIKESEG